MSPGARLLLGQLRDRADECGRVEDDVATVAACSGLPLRAAHRCLGELLATGAVVLDPGGALALPPQR